METPRNEAGQVWTPKPADRVIRHPRRSQISPVRLTMTAARRVQSKALASPLILIYVFAGLVTAGTALLLPPFANTEGSFTPFIDALFTATSASTVTGLVTRESATYWSLYGQAVILVLMFVGGLGIMTMATFLLIFFGQRVPLAHRLIARDSLQINRLGGLARVTVVLVSVAAAMQLMGFAALLPRLFVIYEPVEAVWQALFQAVSAFNNAGFVILPDSASLSAFQGDDLVLGVTAALIFLGAIGYWVILDVIKLRRFSLLPLNTKLVIIMTGLLILCGALVCFFSETDNTLAERSVLDKALVSVFESISGRTAGFSTIDYGATKQNTNFFFIAMMFVGGASGSVAGGIKINTIAVILVAVLSTVQGKPNAAAFGREIAVGQVQIAMTLGALATAFVFVVALALTYLEPNFTFIDLLFEAVSAAGTVGLSTGLTGEISHWGQGVLIASMLLGRVGPLTLALYMASRRETARYRYAQERVTLG